MKWFQVDSDTPNDPRIRSVLATMGNAGLGALLRLWCFVANQGSRPGWSLDSRGRPIDRGFLIEAAGLSALEFDALLTLVAQNGHITEREWVRRGVICFPAMARRADTYTKRTRRTVFEGRANTVRPQDNTRQDKTSNKKKQRRAAPRAADSYRAVLKLAHETLDESAEWRGPSNDAAVVFAELKEQVKRACARHHVAYDADVIGRALESAIASHGKREAVRA